MSFLFGGARKTDTDPCKSSLNQLRRATRSMDREEIKSKAEEKVIVACINKLAKEQKIDLCKSKAKELIRLRVHRKRLMTMKCHMSTLAHQLSTVQSAGVMRDTIMKTSALLKKMNNCFDAKTMHKMILEFEGNSTHFKDGQEILEETLDSVFETDNEGENIDAEISSIFEELHLNLQLLPGNEHPLCPTQPSTEMGSLEERLEKLKMNRIN